MSSLVETMAEAIDPDIWEIDQPLPTAHATIEFYERRRKSIKHARAALQAMLDAGPTERMRAAGEHAWMHRDLSDDESEPIRDCFRAMLRAELDASKETP